MRSRSTTSRQTTAADAPWLYTVAQTHRGWVGILASARGLRRLTLPQASASLAMAALELSRNGVDARLAPEAFLDLTRRLERYFQGGKEEFPDELHLEGTRFQRAVWRVSRSIPWGETRSYSWVAEQVGSPRAARAVGQAMRANTVPFIIPCHRVVGKNGAMCGYGGPEGVELKRTLLNRESTTADRR